MSAKAPPPIPPRPTRSPNNASTSNSNPPKIPPRPTSRPERTSPPKLDNYAPSPLNVLPTPKQNENSPVDHSARPDSSTLPPIDQGYVKSDASVDKDVSSGVEQPAETRSVHQDLHLHAPRPSLPTSSATAQVQAVTRTDALPSHVAGSEDANRRSLYSKTNIPHIQLEDSTASTTRKSFAGDDESGIPEIGQRVPMYPNAGDVQAPSPSPGPTSPRNHKALQDGHKRSRSRQEALPPGSYGLHGHGVTPDDPFEKSWYQKHPKELAQEEQAIHGSGVGSPRPEWAMSTEDLNKIVRSSALRDTSNNFAGTPDEEIGNIMAEEFANRLKSPPAESSLHHEVSRSEPPSEHLSDNQKPEDAAEVAHKPKGDLHGMKIHVNEPLHHQHHPDGFAPALENDDTRGEHIRGTEENDVPVLASDEADPHSVGMQPAVSPPFENQGAEYSGHGKRASGNKQANRPTDATRQDSKKQSEGLESQATTEPSDYDDRYKPLFPHDDKPGRLSPEERFKSPASQAQRFPSKDIWEDAPSSAQLHATVSTPDIPKRPKGGESESGSLFETPEQEQERVREADKLKEHSGLEDAPGPSNDSHVPEHDPNQRFPSRDIWEEAPESQQLTTAIELPQKADKPEAPSLPPRQGDSLSKDQESASPTKSQPSSPTELKKRPSIPEKPKPPVPQRPTRKKSQESGEFLTKTVSGGSTDESTRPVTKAKPALPPRAIGSKITALKAGFLSDLDSRLKLGPQAPKPKEKEKEAEADVERGPLSDARKGRAKGPARRKPASPPIPVAAEDAQKPRSSEIKFAEPWNVWSIGLDGEVSVAGEKSTKLPSASHTESSHAPLPTKATDVPSTLGASELETSKSTDRTSIADKDEHDDRIAPKAVPEVPLPRAEQSAPAPTEPLTESSVNELKEESTDQSRNTGLEESEGSTSLAEGDDKVMESSVPLTKQRHFLPSAEQGSVASQVDPAEAPSKLDHKVESEVSKNTEES